MGGGNYGGGSGGNFSNDYASDNRGSVGGFGGNDAGYNAASNFATGNTFGSESNAGFGSSDYFVKSEGEQFGSNETNTMKASGEDHFEENARDEDDSNDFAKRA
uniref:Putative Gly-rich RNA-binding protein n=1 Tax=Cucumis sativus TaxID=3659 RepID=B7SHL2_CUCSA|nr:putative Gly-rich RNA-binding protein [Cucumis sativus]